MQSPFTPRCAQHKGRERKNKIINDPVHGHMEFGSDVVKIIDTLYFQRLRELKQLGCASFVFPGAVHNRFMHSLGTAHLAEKVIRRLKEKNPKLGITDRDVLMVQLAGLCHDLGHGPFSHEFERVIQDVLKDKRARARNEEELKAIPASWNHEQASEKLFEECVKEAGLEISLDEIELVKAMIRGVERGGERPMGKPLFMFQIVSNTQTGMDVDKYDYLLRDAMFCGAKIAFDISRLLRPEVREDAFGDLVLAYYRKEEWMIHQLFRSRFDMHRQVYGHSVVTAFQLMYAEVLFLARHWLRLDDAIHHPKLYLLLTDGVIHRIECLDENDPPAGWAKDASGSSPVLKKAKDLVCRIKQRDLYTSVLQDINLQGSGKRKSKREVEDEVKRELLIAEPKLEMFEEAIVVVVGDRDFTRKSDNPILLVPFYSERGKSSARAFHLQQTDLQNSTQPAHFWERIVRIFVKEKNPTLIDLIVGAVKLMDTGMTGSNRIAIASPIIRDKELTQSQPSQYRNIIGQCSQSSATPPASPTNGSVKYPGEKKKRKAPLFTPHESEPMLKKQHTGTSAFASTSAEFDDDDGGWDNSI